MATHADVETPSSTQLDDGARFRLIAELRFRFHKPKLPGWYRLGVILVALLMLLLPALYVAIIAATGYGIFWHITEHYRLLDSNNAFKGKWLFVGPIVVGAIMIAFMFKPILARRERTDAKVALSEKKEPFLFAFVSELCRTLGSPKPRRIHVDCAVNASVGFHQGTAGLLGGHRDLTIGLPLAAGMTLQQLTGILAHEFGHLAQGAGMRLGFAIRSVSAWLGHVSYGQDDWDKGLAELPGEWKVFGFVAGFFIRITRTILRGLSWIGSMISSWFSRRMELDADGFEIRVAGSDGFEASTFDLAMLQAAASKVQAQLAASWEERRLAEDLPGLIALEARSLSDENRANIEALVMRSGHGPFASHPRPRDRIAAARQAARQPAFRSDLPASALFMDFAAICRDASFSHYQRTIGKRVKRQNLVPIEDAIDAAGRAGREAAALSRYFHSLANVLAPIPIAKPGTRAARRANGRDEVAALRTRIVEESVAGRSVLADAQSLLSRLWRAENASAFVSAGLPLDADDHEIGASDAVSCRTVARESEEAIASCRADLAPLLDLLAQRLAIGRSLLDSPPPALPPARAAALRSEADRLVEAAAGMNAVLSLFETTCRSHALLNAFLRHVAATDDRTAPTQSALRAALEQSWKRLKDLRQALEKIANPFEQAEGRVPVARHVIPTLGGSRDLKGTYAAGHLAGDRFHGLYFRVLGRLARIGEEVEAALGLEPLPGPPSPPDPARAVG